jgi:hypothetical protein
MTDQADFDVHAIVTRFALPVTFRRGQGDSEKRPSAHLAASWLDNRIRIFNAYCAPSVLQQSSDSFTWILGIDERVPDRIARAISVASGGRGSVLRVPEDETFQDVLRSELGSHGRLILTSRLDSDDAIAPDFVKTVHCRARPDHALNFPQGLIYEARLGLTHHVILRSNPFMSFLSTTGLTVHDLGNHRFWSDRVEVLDIDTSLPMWLQLVHADNVSNGRPKASRMTVQRAPVRRFLSESAVAEPSTVARLGSYLSVSMHRRVTRHESRARRAR